MDIQSIKLRFGIIGNSPLLERAIDIARQVSGTDLTVLITGESGTGKESFPKIIHQLSARKHGNYIAVNCGAIPEGTIDSELFGHEKGSFTGASDARKGYFEVVNGGTIFLDEVADLPLPTQARLLRVLESGEFIKVGSSKVLKTDARVVAATNVQLLDAVRAGRFREDLFYRLNTVPIIVPPLRERKEDIFLLFRKFASDFAEKYRMPSITLDEEAQQLLIHYYWSGNIRQLKNVTEQISVIEKKREINAATLTGYLPDDNSNNNLPVLFSDSKKHQSEYSERELMYKVLFDMKKDINELKKMVFDIIDGEIPQNIQPDKSDKHIAKKQFESFQQKNPDINISIPNNNPSISKIDEPFEIIEESLHLQDKEKDMIIKSLKKNKGKRKLAAQELGISERTLYRKIKEYNLT